MGRESLSQILFCFWDSARPQLNVMQERSGNSARAGLYQIKLGSPGVR